MLISTKVDRYYQPILVCSQCLLIQSGLNLIEYEPSALEINLCYKHMMLTRSSSEMFKKDTRVK